MDFRGENLPRRKNWVDMGKGISMLMVILFHVEGSGVYYNLDISRYFLYFRMPFFFFLSGYLFVSDINNFRLNKKILQIFRGIIWTYFVFTFIVLIPKALLHGYPVTEGVKRIILGYASWFVVVLGVSQVIFSFILWKIKNVHLLAIIILLFLGGGYLLNQYVDISLPFYLNIVGPVLFFFGMGFLYRQYEYLFDSLIANRRGVLFFVFLLIYVVLILVNDSFLKIDNILGGNHSNYYYLYVVYAIVGIIMMLLLSQMLPLINLLSYVGKNSLVFYYFNGGMIAIIGLILENYGIRCQFSNLLNALILFVLVVASIMVESYLIKKYLPIMVGDKKAFNELAKKMHLKIEF